MAHPNGCDWWTPQRMDLYRRPCCPICRGSADDHMRRFRESNGRTMAPAHQPGDGAGGG